MATSQATIPRIPREEQEKKYINHLQAKNHPIITRYITYDKLTDDDKILSYVIYLVIIG